MREILCIAPFSICSSFPNITFQIEYNYRPATNATFLAKVVQRVVAKQLQMFLDETN